VAAALHGTAAAGLQELAERLARPVSVVIDEGAPRERFQIVPC
jgi:hypothetical protein